MFSEKKAKEIYEKLNNKRKEIQEYETKIHNKIIEKEKFNKDEIIEYVNRKINGEALYGINWDLDNGAVAEAFKNIKYMVEQLGE